MDKLNKEDEIRKEFAIWAFNQGDILGGENLKAISNWWLNKMQEERERIDPALKLCPQCYTMKLFSTHICYRCLDRLEARREIEAEFYCKNCECKKCLKLKKVL